jgi:hypothetical protein
MNTSQQYKFNFIHEFDQIKIKSIEMLYEDRKIEFRELSHILLTEKAIKSTPRWKEFVLNFCLDVEDVFKTWSGQIPVSVNSSQKSLTILQQLGHDKASMNQLAHTLNMSYNLSLEFKEIYRHLK